MLKYKDNNIPMPQYKVPQDVQREDTIIGPITLKQLIILGIGSGIAYSIYTTLSRLYFIEIWLPPVILVGAITAAFAFLKINNLPFHLFLLNLLEYVILPRKRAWKQRSGDTFISPYAKVVTSKREKIAKKVKEKKQRSLKELTEIMDSKGKVK